MRPRRRRTSPRRRANPAGARKRFAQYQRTVGASGIEHQRFRAEQRRHLKLLEKAPAGVKDGFCLYSPRSCCRDPRGRFASCRWIGASERAAEISKSLQLAATRKAARAAGNPPRGVVIAEELVRIIYRDPRKRTRRNPRGEYEHGFVGRSWPRVPVIGLPDGSLFIPRGKFPLWGFR